MGGGVNQSDATGATVQKLKEEIMNGLAEGGNLPSNPRPPSRARGTSFRASFDHEVGNRRRGRRTTATDEIQIEVWYFGMNDITRPAPT